VWALSVFTGKTERAFVKRLFWLRLNWKFVWSTTALVGGIDLIKPREYPTIEASFCEKLNHNSSTNFEQLSDASQETEHVEE